LRKRKKTQRTKRSQVLKLGNSNTMPKNMGETMSEKKGPNAWVQVMQRKKCDRRANLEKKGGHNRKRSAELCKKNYGTGP